MTIIKPCTLILGEWELEISNKEQSLSYSAICKKANYPLTENNTLIDLIQDFKRFLGLYDSSVEAVIYRGIKLDLYERVRYWSFTAGCNEIEFCSHSWEYLSNWIPYFQGKVDKYLEEKMNNITHKGYELVVAKSSFRNLFNGECKELQYSDSATTIGLLKLRFRKFVNDRKKDDEVKDRFLVTIDNYVLEVTNFGCHRAWRGSCKEIDFEWGGFILLEDLLSKFRKKIEEQPVKIQYNGYELEVIRKDQDNAWFVGTSDLSLDWKMESATIYLIETAWKKEVDERQQLVTKVKDLQQKILGEQLKLESLLEKEGYVIRNTSNKVDADGRYAIHPDYYKQWGDETPTYFPSFAVIQIW